MKYDSFRDNVFALIDAKDKLKVLIERRVPISIIEKQTEFVAKVRGEALRFAERVPEEVPPLDGVRAAFIRGCKLKLIGDADGDELILLALTIGDIAYPDEILKPCIYDWNNDIAGDAKGES